MQALIAPSQSIEEPGIERIRAVVEAATGYAPETLEDLFYVYRELGKRAYRMLIVLQREDEPEPAVLELRCLDPRGPTGRAERLGLLFKVGRRRCLVYPG